jgi:hypothetical protein
MTLTKEQILTAKDIETKKLHVPAWGGDIYIKGMTGTERDKYESTVMQANGKDISVNMINARARMAAYTICDENGNNIFTEADIKELTKKSAKVLDKVFEIAMKLSGIGENDLSELSKNSMSAQTEDSTSG